MEVQLRTIYITYQEAQSMVSFFRGAQKVAPYTEQRKISAHLAFELEDVRDIDYSPFRGCQLHFQEKDYKIISDTLKMVQARSN